MKILITGGHLTPALAIIDNLPKTVEIVYVGRKHALEGDAAISLEKQIITARDIPFIVFHPARLQRVFTKHTLSSILRFPPSLLLAKKILQKEKPDIILSFGGYVALPFALMGSLLHIPLVTHEQTFGAGATNRLIARFARFVCISWKSSEKYFPPRKTVLTGNPIVQSKPSIETKNMIGKIDKKRPLLAITGGSLGSHTINMGVEQILPSLLEKYSIIHQTGDAKEFTDFDRLTAMRTQLPQDLQERYYLMKFIQPTDVAAIYRRADLVVSRAGANTVQLLLLLNKPALLIPLSYGQRNEQKTNADFFIRSGLGEEITENSLNPQKLFSKIESMLYNKKNYTNFQQKEMEALHDRAALRIIECIYAACQKNSTYTQTNYRFYFL